MGTVRQAIKRDARAALKNRTGTAALITFFLLAVSFVVGLFEGVVPLMLGAPTFFQNLAESATPWEAALSSAPWFLLFAALMALVSLIFMAPMSVGAADWFISCTDGQENGAAHIFWPFGCKKFWGSLVLFIATYIISLFWAVLFLALPGGLIGYAVYSLYYLDLSPVLQTLTIVGLIAGVLFLLVVLIFLAVFLSRYWLAIFLMGKKYGKGPFGALAMSVRITKGHRFETFGFALSFLPWLLLNIFVIPTLFTVPYAAMSMALYTRYLAELYENKAQTPMTLPAYGEGPALLDALHEEQPAADPVPEEAAEEVVEAVDVQPAEEVAEETAETIEDAPVEKAEPEMAEETESLPL